MRLAIIGHGIAGFAIAHLATKQGHEVMVFEREPGPLQGTSEFFWKMHFGHEYLQHFKSAVSCLNGHIAWRASLGEIAWQKITYGESEWRIMDPSDANCDDLKMLHHYLHEFCRANDECAAMPGLLPEVSIEYFPLQSGMKYKTSQPRVACRLTGLTSEKNINRTGLLEYIEEQSKNVTTFYNTNVTSVTRSNRKFIISYTAYNSSMPTEEEGGFDFVVDATGAWSKDNYKNANVRGMVKVKFPPHVEAGDLAVVAAHGGLGSIFSAMGNAGGMMVHYDPGQGGIELQLFMPGSNGSYFYGRSRLEGRQPNEIQLSLEHYQTEVAHERIGKVLNHLCSLHPALAVDIAKHKPNITMRVMPLMSDPSEDPRVRTVLNVQTVEPGHYYAPLAKGTHAFLLAREVMDKIASELFCHRSSET